MGGDGVYLQAVVGSGDSFSVTIKEPHFMPGVFGYLGDSVLFILPCQANLSGLQQILENTNTQSMERTPSGSGCGSLNMDSSSQCKFADQLLQRLCFGGKLLAGGGAFLCCCAGGLYHAGDLVDAYADLCHSI